LNTLSRFAFEPERVEKPWGWELIWAHAEEYVGKLLFVRAGHALSKQFHKVKDESWYFQEGRAELELNAPGEAVERRRRSWARAPHSASSPAPSTS